MANSDALVPIGEVVGTLSLTDLCNICGLSADWIIELVDEGLLEPKGSRRSVWQFESVSITVVQKVQRLQSDLRLNIPGVAVALSLVEENARLKRRVRLLENDPRYAIYMPSPDS